MLISGGGSNLRALLEAAEDAEFPARVVAIGADRQADGLVLGEEFGIPTFSVPFTAYPDRESWGAALIEEVRRWEPDLVVLSGLMRLVPPAVVDAFSPHLINTHPAYLPEFPGAHAVRDALAAGVDQTGASLIVVDNSVDGGPIIAQERIPVLPGDTSRPARSHQARRAAPAHRGGARHRQLASRPEGIRTIMSTHSIDPSRYRERDVVRVRRALVAVSDKRGLVELATALTGAGVEIVSTGGTAAAIAAAGLPVTQVPEVTGYPEHLDGRVTHAAPRRALGLLADLRLEDHERQLAELGIKPFELVVVNLYPFAETVAAGAAPDAVIEQIDIGGPAMVRASAKNHANVAVVVSPDRYDEIVAAVESGGTTLAQRASLAREAFRHTASYDVAVASYIGSVIAPDQPADESPFPAWVGGT